MSTAPSPPSPTDPALREASAAALSQAGLRPGGPADGASFLEQLQQSPALDDRLTRRALSGLAAWQTALHATPHGAALPPIDEAALRTELDAFAGLAHGQQGNAPWTDVQHKGWQRASQALLDSALAQPRVPLLGPCSLASFQGSATDTCIAGFETPRLGPVTWDLASLLRDPRRSLDEAAELDHAIRYWELLRRSALPLGEPWNTDFGEFWRAAEWTAMLQHLGRLGRHLSQPGTGGAELPALLEWGTRVAMRYRPLQPLVSLIEPWTGARLAAGFTF